MQLYRVSILALLSAGSSLAAAGLTQAPVAGAAPVLTCAGPVRRDDSEVSLRRRIHDARREAVGGPEGTTLPALVLWPKDPARRLEVIFADEGQRRVDLVRPAPGSRWRIAGIGLGDSLARVQAVNGDGLRFSGFGWDYGGYVSGFGRGRIGRLAGGCVVGMRLDVPGSVVVPNRLAGEAQHSTREPGVARLGIRVGELSLAWRR